MIEYLSLSKFISYFGVYRDKTKTVCNCSACVPCVIIKMPTSYTDEMLLDSLSNDRRYNKNEKVFAIPRKLFWGGHLVKIFQQSWIPRPKHYCPSEYKSWGIITMNDNTYKTKTSNMVHAHD